MLNITAATGVSCGGVLTVTRGRLIVSSSAGDAISVSDNMLVKGGTVSCTANVKTGAVSALNVGGSIIVSGGSVSANGNGVAGAVYSGGDLAVSAGTLIAGATATSALEISGSAIITGGTVNAFSEGEDAPAVNIFGGDFSVTSAEVEIAAIADGIYLGIGCFTLNSGSLDIVSEEGNAITVSSDLGDVFVYGGDLTVKADKGNGIYSPMSPVTIGKGNVDITAGNDGIVSGSAIIVDAPVESLVIKSLNSDKDADYSALKIDDKDLLSLDSILAVSVSLSSDGSSAEALDTAKLGDYDYIYIRRPVVHVGGIGLGIGDYLAEGATASTATAVSGDRAYLEKVGGELRLNLVDFDLASDADGIVSDGALTLVLSGTSKISAKDYALMVDGALTIGAGNLELSSSANCAVWLDGDLTVEGNVTVNGKEAGIFGADTLEVKNGDLDVTSGKTGIYANNITVNGGELTAVSTDTNSDAEYSAVELLGGTLTGGSGLIILASVDPNGVLGAYNAADIATYDIIKVGTVAVGSVDLTLSDYDLDLDASGVKVTTGTTGIKLDSFGLCTDDAGTAADGKITHNVQYYLKAVLSAEEGYYFDETAITLDGVTAAKSELSDGVYTVYFKLDVLEREITSAELDLSDYDLDLDASGVKVTTGTAGIKLDGFGLCTDDAGTAADGKITHNVQYYLKAVLSAEEGYYFGEAAITLDGVTAVKSELSDGVYTVYFKLDVLEREITSAELDLSDYDLDLDASGVKVTTGTAGIKLDSFCLCTDDAGTAADGKITHNVQYYLKVVFSAKEGYDFGDTVAVTLDGVAAVKSELSDGVYTVYFKLDILERSTVVVGGTVKNYLDFTETITVELYKAGSDILAYTTTTVGEDAIYSFGAVEPGEYILKVSKADHVTREYAVIADSTDITLDLKIHLRGDINGDGRVNTTDVGRANAHAKKTNILEGYEFACADVSNDGRVNTTDVGRMNAHAKKTNLLW